MFRGRSPSCPSSVAMNDATNQVRCCSAPKDVAQTPVYCFSVALSHLQPPSPELRRLGMLCIVARKREGDAVRLEQPEYPFHEESRPERRFLQTCFEVRPR